jgi:hypothetical protein
MGRKPKIRSLTIIGRRWFDKINGNTYFSAVGLINGKKEAQIDFEYGYSDHYKHCIVRELINNGWKGIPPTTIYSWCKDKDIAYYSDVVDVSRRKDL